MSHITEDLKQVLGEIPLTAELYWLLKQRGAVKRGVGKMGLSDLQEVLPAWVEQSQAARSENPSGRKVMVFGMIHFWISFTSLLGLTLAGLGHNVTLAFLPYVKWKESTNLFDVRRQDLYTKDILKPAAALLNPVSMLSDMHKKAELNPKLEEIIERSAYFDTQYSLLLEEIDAESDLYKLRRERNQEALLKAVAWLEANKPDAVIVPNGSILEFGMVYQAAKYLGIPVSTFEFGEQEERMWMAQDDEVMRQDTAPMWEQKGADLLTEEESVKIKELFSARQGAKLWENFSRQWQGTASQGAQEVRKQLGLDDRPLALIPANVLGDSLTLDRQTFSETMTDWLKKTVVFFGEHPEFQLVIRVHPGETIGWGPSVYDILQEAIPEFPANVWLLPADAKVNTYDLVEAADLGLVFTTTVGMEMALSGKPVIVTGNTHYRGKGFTIDPESWDEFFGETERVLNSPEDCRLTDEQVELVWRYAYRFFFDYPQPFPWHVQQFWKRQANWSIEDVLSPQGLEKFSTTFEYLTNEKQLWRQA